MRGRPPKKADQLTGFGARIRGRRIKRGLTIRQAAASCGVSESTWRGWEVDGKSDAAAKMLFRIAYALGYSAYELLSEQHPLP